MMIFPVSSFSVARHARLLVDHRPHRVGCDVEREHLVRRLHAFVEVDRRAVLRPEVDRHVAVEACAELAEGRAAGADVAQIHALVVHEHEVVRRREGDGAAVGGEAHAALGDLRVLRDPLDLSGADFEQIQVGVDVLLEDVAVVAVGGDAAEPDPLAVGRDVEVADAVRGVAREARRALRVEVERPEARDRHVGVAHAHVESLLETQPFVRIGGVRRDEVDRASSRATSATGRCRSDDA